MNITIANLNWWAAALIAAGAALGWVVIAGSVLGWVAGRYEITRQGFRLHVTRRWYGSAAQVTLRSAAGDDDPDRFAVLTWWTEDTIVPWLLVHKLDPEYLTYWDEDAEAFWAPVTDFAPYAVRKVRPYFYRFGRVWLPWLTKWCPEPASGSYLPDGA